MWWPNEFGGQDLPYWYQLILVEELAFWQAPRDPLYIGWERVAWSILILGTREQKLRYLPAIKNVEQVWCQCFTEPDAGSDLASLRTSAKRDGDVYVVTGSKIYISWAHRATHALAAVRTNAEGSKHEGISLLIIDMNLPGVNVVPLPDITATVGHEPHFNEVFFDEVRVPVANLLGTENNGWKDLQTTLSAERAGVAVSRLGYCRRAIAALEGCWESIPENLRNSPSTVQSLANMRTQLEIIRLLAYRVAWEQENGMLDSVQSSLAKLFGGEFQQNLYEAIYALWPEAMQVIAGGDGAILDGFFPDHLMESIHATIGGGTSEIIRTVIARRGLGLPA